MYVCRCGNVCVFGPGATLKGMVHACTTLRIKLIRKCQRNAGSSLLLGATARWHKCRNSAFKSLRGKVTQIGWEYAGNMFMLFGWSSLVRNMSCHRSRCAIKASHTRLAKLSKISGTILTRHLITPSDTSRDEKVVDPFQRPRRHPNLNNHTDDQYEPPT